MLLAATQDTPRLKTLLPNGATIIVERMPNARYVSVQLFLSVRSVPDKLATYGHRHLLEHLSAKGSKRDLDQRIEGIGAFLVAETLRDAMRFEVRCAAGQLEAAIDVHRELLRPVSFSADEIANERRVLRNEFALEPDSKLLSAALWRGVFGEQGLDPLGDSGSVAAATPTSLQELHRRVTAAPNVTIAVCGPIEVDRATSLARALLRDLPGKPDVPWERRAPGRPGRFEDTGAEGEARGALVGGFSEPETMWALAAALAIGAECDPAFVTYTPTLQAGLVIVGREGGFSGFGVAVDKLGPADASRLFRTGKSLGARWISGYLERPSGCAYLRGLLLSQAIGARPEAMLENLTRMDPSEFARGLKMLQRDQAAVGIGVRR